MAVFNTETFGLKILENMSKWGSTTLITEQTPGEYRGKAIQLTKDSNGRYTYLVTQTKIMKAMDSGKVPPARVKEGGKLSNKEMAEFRSIVGSLQWLSGQTRPDPAAAASLTHRGSNTETSDLQKVYEAIDYAAATSDCGIRMTAANFTSQYGVVVVLCPAQVSETTCFGFLVDWKSGRMQRVARCTLAPEAHAADAAADRACFINYYLTDLLCGIPPYKAKMEMPMKQATDAKGLYDCLVAENPSTSEKRSMVSIRSVQQAMSPKQVHWIPTYLMHTHGLTKIDAKLPEILTRWCMNPWCQLRDEDAQGSKVKTGKHSGSKQQKPAETPQTNTSVKIQHVAQPSSFAMS